MNVIETGGLARRFGRLEAVRGLDLNVPAGSVFALVGPNGAGKTTVIKLLMNLLQPSAGSARVLGVDSRSLGVPQFQSIGYVSENQQLPEWMTPGQFFGYCRPFYPAWDRDLERHLQRQLVLTSDAKIRSLSRGTRMKVALLAALAFHPELVVLDEPFSGLDPLVRDELIQALLHVSADRRWTVLISSHDVEEIERLCDWVAFMKDGRLVMAEPVDALLKRCRLVEVVSPDGSGLHTPKEPDWIPQGTAGRTLRFVDTRHDLADAERRISSVFPGATLSVEPLSLREIFVAFARDRGPAEMA